MDALIAIFLVTAAAPSGTVSADGAEAAEEERLICKRPRTTATRVAAKRVCRTWAEWQEAAAQPEEGIDGFESYSRRNGTLDVGGLPPAPSGLAPGARPPHAQPQ